MKGAKHLISLLRFLQKKSVKRKFLHFKILIFLSVIVYLFVYSGISMHKDNLELESMADWYFNDGDPELRGHSRLMSRHAILVKSSEENPSSSWLEMICHPETIYRTDIVFSEELNLKESHEKDGIDHYALKVSWSGMDDEFNSILFGYLDPEDKNIFRVKWDMFTAEILSVKEHFQIRAELADGGYIDHKHYVTGLHTRLDELRGDCFVW